MNIDQERSRELFRKLSALALQLPVRPVPEAIHQFRTTSRRIETLLAAMFPEPTPRHRKLLRLMKRLRRRAGRVRDIDVQIAALKPLKIGRDAERKSALLHALTERRSRREHRLAIALDDQTVGRFCRRLERMAGEVALAPEQAPHIEVLDPVRKSLDMFADLAKQYSDLSEASLHAYRMDCKRVRYVAEMAGETSDAETIVGELKRLQDAIGEWHDWDELTRYAEKLFAPASEGPLLIALRNVRGAKFEEALAIAGAVRQNLLAMAATLRLPKRPGSQRLRKQAGVA